MLNQDYTAKLLNLEDVIITKVENISEELHIYLELPRKANICPACGRQTDRVHDYRKQVIKAGTPSSSSANAVTAAPAASASSNRTPFCPVTTVSPAGWFVP